MTDDGLPQRIYDLYEETAPSVTLDDLRRHRREHAGPDRTPLVRPIAIATAIVLLGGILVLVAQLTAGDESAEVEVAAGGERDWPVLYVSNLGLSELLEMSSISGDILGAIPPDGQLASPVSGATVAADGRVAISSGPRVTIADDGDVYEVSLVGPDDQGDHVTGGLRVLPVPDRKAAWIMYDGLPAGGSLWQWVYETGDLELSAEQLPSGLVPVGVSSEGDLVLNEMTGHSPGADQLWIFDAQSTDAEPTVLEGEGLAMYRSLVLIRRCEEPSQCSLLVHDLAGGEAREVTTGGLEADRIHSVAPEGPGYSVPATVSHEATGRVLVGVETASGQEGRLSTLAALDMDDLSLSVLSDDPVPVASAVWSCDGSDVLVYADGAVRSLSGSVPETGLPEGTFLYGTGDC